MSEIKTELLFTLTLEISARHVVGITPFGRRGMAHVTGGRFEGPKLAGRVLPGGGDWPLQSTDGALLVDARLTLEADGGDIIYMIYRGIRRAAPDVLERLNRGEEVDSSSYYFRTAAFFEAGSPKYLWLNYVVAIGSGHRIPGGIAYAIHQVL